MKKGPAKRRQQQDSPKNIIRVAKKRELLVKLFSEGKTVRGAAKALKAEGFTKGTSRAQVGRDLFILSREAPQCIEDARLEAREQLRGLRDLIVNAERLGLKDQVNLLLAVHDRYSRLLGLDAPAKSINAVVTAPSLVAMDFGDPVEKTSDLVSEAEYLDTVERSTAIVKAGIEE